MSLRASVAHGRRVRELKADHRAGSFSRAKARKLQAAWASERRWILAAMAGILMTPLLVMLFIPSAFVRGVIVGGVVVAVPAVLWQLVVSSTGTAPTMNGDEAEQWTAQELRKVGRRCRRGEWFLVNRVPFDRHDIDHVLLGPWGVLVVETKWSAASWDDRDGVERQQRAVAQVRGCARRLGLWGEIRKILRDGDIALRPVVVIWGANAGSLDVTAVDGCAVVPRRHLRRWVEQLPRTTSAASSAAAIWARLDRFIADREAHEPSLTEIPSSMTDRALGLLQYPIAAAATFVALILMHNILLNLWLLAVNATAAALIAAFCLRVRSIRRIAIGALAGAGGVICLIAVAYAIT